MPANPGGDDDTPVRGKEPVPAEVDPASPETRAAERGRSPGLRPRAGRPIGMAGPFGGAQHLVDEAFGPRRAGAADAPWPNAKKIGRRRVGKECVSTCRSVWSPEY